MAQLLIYPLGLGFTQGPHLIKFNKTYLYSVQIPTRVAAEFTRQLILLQTLPQEVTLVLSPCAPEQEVMASVPQWAQV